MSLKAFHVFFISISILFTLGFGIWAVNAFEHTGDVSDLLMGIGSFLGTVALIIYFRWFLKKLKNESYL